MRHGGVGPHAHQEARLYIDPSTGSLILQVVAAGAITAAASVKRARDSIGRFFRGLFGGGKER